MVVASDTQHMLAVVEVVVSGKRMIAVVVVVVVIKTIAHGART